MINHKGIPIKDEWCYDDHDYIECVIGSNVSRDYYILSFRSQSSWLRDNYCGFNGSEIIFFSF